MKPIPQGVEELAQVLGIDFGDPIRVKEVFSNTEDASMGTPAVVETTEEHIGTRTARELGLPQAPAEMPGSADGCPPVAGAGTAEELRMHGASIIDDACTCSSGCAIADTETLTVAISPIV